MGVNTFLLDRHAAALDVAGTKHVIGMLRRFFKLTEMNDERSVELEAAENSALGAASPAAVIDSLRKCSPHASGIGI